MNQQQGPYQPKQYSANDNIKSMLFVLKDILKELKEIRTILQVRSGQEFQQKRPPNPHSQDEIPF